MNVGICGLGLMGGSFGRTLVKKGAHKVYAADVSENALLKGEMLKAYDERLTKNNASELDLFIAAVTPDKIRSVFEEYLPLLKKGATVIDFCGIKRPIVSVMREFSKMFPELVFIGGHPMAGREFSGIERSTTTLFEKASMVLVNVNADIFTLDEAKSFFINSGFGEVVFTDADKHDEMIAYTSQLCHVVSNAFIKNENAVKHSGFSAGSYKDLTRVARLNPDMWTTLMSENRDKLTKELDELIGHLSEYREALRANDTEKLRRLLAEGNERKISIDVKNAKKGE